MDLRFDIAQDELPIFLAETGDQLQVLDEELVQLERAGEDQELLQGLFRAAHTLKGTAGMIGHKRMVTVTHALETALDGLRKKLYPISTQLIDICLEAVDAIRVLREEVVSLEASPVDVDQLAARFSDLAKAQPASDPGAPSQQLEQSDHSQKLSSGNIPGELDGADLFQVYAKISEGSFSSAARALQLFLALQELGAIINIHPSQEAIETAKPVSEVTALFKSSHSIPEIVKVLESIGELEQVKVDMMRVETAPSTPVQAGPPVSPIQPVAQAAGAKGNGPEELEAQRVSPAQRIVAEKTVRTNVERLDSLMNLVGELITDRNRLYQIRSNLQFRFRGDEQIETLSQTSAHIGRITDQLQNEVMSIRMLPVANVFNKFPRMVRDLSAKFGKKVDLIIEGEDTELDRSVIEEISDPLIHLIRNCIDHGVETAEDRVKLGKTESAHVKLTARYEQGRIVLTVEDDGQGINVARVKSVAIHRRLITEAEANVMSEDEAVNMIFVSGFSTAKVVSDISGRGVGLDIARNNVQKLNGSIMVETWQGKGTRFQISLPLTLAIIPTLLVKVGRSTLAIPLVTVMETMRIKDGDIQKVNNRPVILLRDKVLSLISLTDTFKMKSEKETGQFRHVVVVLSGKQQMGLVVDHLLGQEEVVVKSLGPLIGQVFGIASAAILSDGQAILIIDVQELFRGSGSYFDRQKEKQH